MKYLLELCLALIVAFAMTCDASAQQLTVPGGGPFGGPAPATLAPGPPVLATPVPGVTNGWLPILSNGLSTTVKTIKNQSGTLGGYFCYNPNASVVAYIQFFDVAGTVTLGTTLPIKSIGIPAASAGNLEWMMGVHFSNAIKVAATTTATGSTALGSAVDCNFDIN